MLRKKMHYICWHLTESDSASYLMYTGSFGDLTMTLGSCRVETARLCTGWTEKNGSESVPDDTNCRAIIHTVILENA